MAGATAGGPKASFHSMFAFALMMSIGAGVLSLPQNVSRTGVCASLVLSLYVGFAVLWCMQLMLRAKTVCEEHGVRIATYQDLGTILLGGEAGRRVVELSVCGFQLGVLCVYFDFIATCLVVLFPTVFVGARRVAWMAVFYVPICAACCLRYLRDLGFVAEVAISSYVIGWCIIVIICAVRVGNMGFENTRLEPKHTEWSVVGLFGALCYSFEGVPASLCQMVDTLEERPRAAELITVSILAILGVYVFTEYVGAFAFVRPGDPLSLSLVEHYGLTFPSISLNLLIVFAVFLKYPLQFFPMITIFERNMNFGPGARLRANTASAPKAIEVKPSNYSRVEQGVSDDNTPLLRAKLQEEEEEEDDTIWISRSDGGVYVVMLRSAIVALTAVVALVVPNLTDLIDLVGVLFAPVLAIVFPCIFDLGIKRKFAPIPSMGVPFETSLTIFFLTTGIIGWLFGSTQQITNLASGGAR
ncbi:hypothetical protein CTAYLR_009352 [Chrysophaeum taylorii]|uniref:Amino acid transporter transmembrane domain-containing protein n=1 Tax=Chrysophaeum taylorii TaxID=2483200 RepID=A0AAD7XS58_9STRA|nr:hypothetical protein CTAYLR_009352 [Chrysophaeum taylorii]